MFWRNYTYLERCASPGVSPVETIEDNASEQIRVYDVSWPLRIGAIRALKGYPQRLLGLGGKPFLSRVTPHFSFEWDDLDGFPYLYCQRVECQGIGLSPVAGSITTTIVNDDGSEEVPVYTTARLTATYRTYPFDILTDQQMAQGNYEIDDVGVESGVPFVDANGNPDESFLLRYVSRQVHPMGEFFTIPPNGPQGLGMQYVGLAAGQSTIVAQGVAKLIVPYNIEYTWHQVPADCIPCLAVNPTLNAKSFFDLAVGRVNLDQFDGFNPGTLLLMGAVFKPGRSAFGDRIYDITYLMKWFEPTQGPGLDVTTGHNFLFRPQSNGYIEVTSNGVSNLATANPPLTGLVPNVILSVNRVVTAAFAALFPGKKPPLPGLSIYDWVNFGPLFRSV